MEPVERQENQFTKIGQLIFNKSPYMLYIFKLDGTMVDCNKKAEEWLGYNRSEIIGENYLTLSEIPAELLPKMRERLKRIAQGEIPVPFDMQLYKRDGSIAWINAYISFLQLDNEKLFLAIIQDVTEKKKKLSKS